MVSDGLETAATNHSYFRIKSMYISNFCILTLSSCYLEITVFIHIFPSYFYCDTNSRLTRMSRWRISWLAQLANEFYLLQPVKISIYIQFFHRLLLFWGAFSYLQIQILQGFSQFVFFDTAFWNIVAILVPSYADAKEWLKNNGSEIEIDFYEILDLIMAFSKWLWLCSQLKSSELTVKM